MVLRKRTSAAGFGNVCRDDAEEDNLFYIHIDIYIYIFISLLYTRQSTPMVIVHVCALVALILLSRPHLR